MSVARSSSDMFTIGRIAYRREGFSSPLKMHYRPRKGDGSAQRGRSIYATYDCLVNIQINMRVNIAIFDVSQSSPDDFFRSGFSVPFITQAVDFFSSFLRIFLALDNLLMFTENDSNHQSSATEFGSSFVSMYNI